MEKGRQVCGGEVVNSFKCYDKDLEVDAMFNGEPVKLLKDGCDVVSGRGLGDYAGSCYCRSQLYKSCYVIYAVISNVTDPSPSVTVLIRGTAGRHAWTMQLIHQPRGARANQRVRSQCQVLRHKKARY